MSTSIPMDFVAAVTPAVDAVAGSAVDVVGVLLTTSRNIPVGVATDFASPTAVQAVFGASSPEYAYASHYFAADDDATATPANLILAQYPTAPVPAAVLGASGITLAALQAITSGTLTVSLSGSPITAGNVNLSGAGSFSAVAAAVQSALGHFDAEFTGSIAENVLTVTAMASGALAVGQVLTEPALTILEQLSGTTGGAGTYQLSGTATVASSALTAGALAVAYSPTLGAFVLTAGTPGAGESLTVAQESPLADAMGLSASAGAAVSVGSAAAVPADFMTAFIAGTSDWATFTTAWEPSPSDKAAFSAWNSSQGDKFAYVAWSTEAADVDPNATTGGFYLINAAEYDGTYYTYAPMNGLLKAAFIMGAAAAIDFTKPNSRRNFAYLKQSTLSPDVIDLNTASVLKAKGINFYGKLSSRKNSYTREMFGSITGKFKWMDSYVNQIWLNSNLQEDLFIVLDTYPNIPYNSEGSSYISDGLADTIATALAFGAIQVGVTPSVAEANAIKALTGADYSSVLQTQGWALAILPAAPTVRSGRGSPPIYFFYMDGGSVNTLNLTSTEVQ